MVMNSLSDVKTFTEGRFICFHDTLMFQETFVYYFNLVLITLIVQENKRK